jgi:hypothetical protein
MSYAVKKYWNFYLIKVNWICFFFKCKQDYIMDGPTHSQSHVMNINSD